MVNGLKRLSGAKEAVQDDFQRGVGTYIVKFDAVPAVKPEDVKKALPKYKIESTGLKLTVPIDDPTQVSGIRLANPPDEDLLKEVAALKGKKAVLSGTLTADDKGQRTLTLSKVAAAE